MAETLELTVGERVVRVSHPEKVYFPQRGFTKADLVNYYLSVGDGILRAVRNRPTTLERYIHGVEGDSFFQKRAPKNLPDWIPTARIAFPSGRFADEICPPRPPRCCGRPTSGPSPSTPGRPPRRHRPTGRAAHRPRPAAGHGLRRRRVGRPPAPGGPRRARSDRLPKTSGGRGLHVFVPIAPSGPSPRCAARPSPSAGSWSAARRSA